MPPNLVDRDRRVLTFLERNRADGNEWVAPRGMRFACDGTYRDHPTLVKRRNHRGAYGLVSLYSITDAGRSAMGFD